MAIKFNSEPSPATKTNPPNPHTGFLPAAVRADMMSDFNTCTAIGLKGPGQKYCKYSTYFPVTLPHQHRHRQQQPTAMASKRKPTGNTDV